MAKAAAKKNSKKSEVKTKAKTDAKTKTKEKAVKKTEAKTAKKTVKKTAKKADEKTEKKTPKTKPKKVIEAEVVSELKLDSDLDIENVALLKDALKELAEAGDEITLDASDVSFADTSSIQLLIAFREKLSQMGKKLIWKDVSEAFLEPCAMLGLENYFVNDQTEDASEDDDDDLCPVF